MVSTGADRTSRDRCLSARSGTKHHRSVERPSPFWRARGRFYRALGASAEPRTRVERSGFWRFAARGSRTPDIWALPHGAVRPVENAGDLRAWSTFHAARMGKHYQRIVGRCRISTTLSDLALPLSYLGAFSLFRKSFPRTTRG